MIKIFWGVVWIWFVSKIQMQATHTTAFHRKNQDKIALKNI